MKKIRALGILLVLVLALTLVGVASAQDGTGDGDPPPSEPTTITGTVIAVDPIAGTVTILQDDGNTVEISLASGEYDHPIVELLAAYFGTDYAGDWAAALETLNTTDGVVTEVVDNGDGTWTLIYSDSTTGTTDDPELVQTLTDALAALEVSIEVETDGTTNEMTLPDTGSDIAAYHDSGIGFGELVKVYAIAEASQAACEAEAADSGADPATAEPCGVTVDDLIAMLQGGMGMGQLFALYGKPALLGVGHVRKALGDTAGTTSDGSSTDSDGDSNTGICNARSKGGNANANGQDVNCP